MGSVDGRTDRSGKPGRSGRERDRNYGIVWEKVERVEGSAVGKAQEDDGKMLALVDRMSFQGSKVMEEERRRWRSLARVLLVWEAKWGGDVGWG